MNKYNQVIHQCTGRNAQIPADVILAMNPDTAKPVSLIQRRGLSLFEGIASALRQPTAGSMSDVTERVRTRHLTS